MSGCKIPSLDPFATGWVDVLVSKSCERLGPTPPRFWLSKVAPTRTWTGHPTRSVNNECHDYTWPRVVLPPNLPPIDDLIPLQSRAGWENGDVEVYARYKPNPVPTHVVLFSKESFMLTQTVALPLSCLGLWDHGNGPATVARHLAFFVGSFEVPYLLTLIPQGLYGRDRM